MPTYIDTHAHYFDRKYAALDGGAESILTDAGFAAVTRAVVNVGTNPQNSRAAVAQAKRYPFMVAAVGIHPEDAQGLPDGTPLDPATELEALGRWLSDPAARRRDKIVAIGEIGLDYYWQPVDKPLQKAFFTGQLALAAALDMPVIIHDREAHGDCLDMVRQYPTVRGVFHGYSGSAEMARELTRRGWYIAFGGAATFKNARRVREVVASVEPSRILLETDCPYLAPVPHRGELNHSGLIPCIAEVVAPLCGMTVEELAEVTCRNAEELFRLSEVLG